MRAIECCVFLALLMTASAVPASSSKGSRPDDPVKGKKTTSIASVKNSTATTAASRPIVGNATLPYTIRNTTLHSSSPSSIATTTAVTSATTMLKLPAISPTPSIATTSTATTSSSISSTASLATISDPQNAGSSPAFTETSPRIISPTPQHTAATVLSLRKSAVSAVADVTTTVPLTSAKETRESPGKIRPQIKLTTNYTSEVSALILTDRLFDCSVYPPQSCASYYSVLPRKPPFSTIPA